MPAMTQSMISTVANCAGAYSHSLMCNKERSECAMSTSMQKNRKQSREMRTTMLSPQTRIGLGFEG